MLEPGGPLVLSDTLKRTYNKSQDPLQLEANYVKDLSQYRELYLKAGFDQVQIIDATDETWIRFYEYTLRFLCGRFARGEIGQPAFIQRVRSLFQRGEQIRDYVLVYARKPEVKRDRVMAETEVLTNDERTLPPVSIPAGSLNASRNSDGMAAPLFILAPPRSFTSIVCAMLGQHPQMYGLPETQLLTSETLAEQWHRDSQASPRIRHGLLRVVAQLYFGDQSAASVKLARGWLRRRAHFSTGLIFELLAERIQPLIPVEKSPDVVHRLQSLRRLYYMFPQGRFLHLLRHPRGHGESNVEYFRARAQRVSLPPSHWVFWNSEHPRPVPTADDGGQSAKTLDPQLGWFIHNMNICNFLGAVPEEQKMWIRGEDLLSNPNEGLRRIADWLKLRTDDEAIDEMKHPERSPYAFIGPPGARYGNSSRFLENPVLRPDRAKQQNLDGPLSWREDGSEFLPKVKELARQFGYE